MIPNHIEKQFGTGSALITLRYDTKTGVLEKKYKNRIHGEWWKPHGDGIGTKGYKMIQINGRKKYTHRVIWEIVHGHSIPEGMTLYLKKKQGSLDPNNIYTLHQDTGDQITLLDILKVKFERDNDHEG